MRTLTSFLFAALVAAAPVAGAQAPRPMDREQLERRLGTVEALIERSSAAQQIEASSVPAAKEMRERARIARSEAESAYRAGDLAKATTLVLQASKLVLEGARMATAASTAAARRETEFRTRLESAKSLAEAQRRIAAEKKDAQAAQTSKAIEEFLSQAEARAAAGQWNEATTSLEQGYLLARAAIGSMRGGDTLVRSLHFGSKEEEYHYEIDRNETHVMLLKLLPQAVKAGGTIEKATELRAKAEAAARARDFETAIRLLDESTRDLARAIRAGGIYIPG